MTDKTLKLGYSWADMCDSDEELPPLNFAQINIKGINATGKDTNEQFIETKEDRKKTITLKESSFLDKKIVDKPENLNELYVERKEEYKKQQQKPINTLWRVPDDNKWIEVKKKNKNKKKSRCYTCFPRKKVSEHIIQKNKYTTFHHDMCNRNIIVATPNKHFSGFVGIGDNIIGTLFKDVDKFCKDWNINDYSVTYNQGEWQTHSHFHLKIKTHDHVIKRLRGDHWRRQKIIKERQLCEKGGKKE